MDQVHVEENESRVPHPSKWFDATTWTSRTGGGGGGCRTTHDSRPLKGSGVPVPFLSRHSNLGNGPKLMALQFGLATQAAQHSWVEQLHIEDGSRSNFQPT